MYKTAVPCLIIGVSLLLAACGPGNKPQPVTATLPDSTAAPSVPASPTPDPCNAENLPDTVNKVNTYMRQFDNKATIASGAAQSELAKIIPDMEALRRSAGDEAIPACLAELKGYELLYMDTVIKTLHEFLGTPKANIIAADILEARKYHAQYTTELARLTGLALPATPSSTPVTATPSQPTETATATVTIVTNPGPNPLNLHVSASLTSESVGLLNATQQAQALGKTASGEWILIEVPGQAGQNAWVYASLVVFSSGDLSSLPIAAP